MTLPQPVKPSDYVWYDDPPHLDKDFYKVGHVFQYPANTQIVYSNFTPRSFKHAIKKLSKRWDKKVVFLGLSGFIQSYLEKKWHEGFFSRPWSHVEWEYRVVVENGLGQHIPLEHLKALHDLGYLPLEIRALAEGSLVPENVPVFTINNTDLNFGWLTNALETVISSDMWGVMTVATIARDYRKISEYWSERNGSPIFMHPYQGHDFSFRGLLIHQAAGPVGFGHLSSFIGTDTLPAIWYAMRWYGADPSKENIGQSVPATEHSVMCIDGPENEFQTYVRMLELYPTGIVSIVSDTYDFWAVLTKFAVLLKDSIIAREGRVVFRPDTGNPIDIICGTSIGVKNLRQDSLLEAYYAYLDRNDEKPEMFHIKDMETGKYYSVFVKDHTESDGKEKIHLYHRVIDDASVTSEMKGAYQILYDIFGGNVNPQGFIDLMTKVGLIYGDSITNPLYDLILYHLYLRGFSHSNLVVGIGSYSYQYNSRDTFGNAIKATAAVVNSEIRAIQKKPKTGDGIKTSALGVLSVKEVEGDLKLDQNIQVTADQLLSGQYDSGELKVVHRRAANTHIFVPTYLESIRNRLGWSGKIAA